MKYPLEVMLKIRKMREQTIEAELARAERLLQEAIDNLERKKKALQDYRWQRSKRVTRWWEQIKGKAVQMYKVEKIQFKIQRLYEAETSYIQRVEHAGMQRDNAQRKVEATRNKLLQVIKDKQKLEEHRTIWSKAEEVEQIKKNEEEIEDLLLGKYTKR